MITISKDAEFLDNTMLSTYKECPRRFLMRHILHWRRAGLATPLAFGLSWHDAMDVVWSHAKSISKNDLPRFALAKFLETWEEQGMDPEPSLEILEALGSRHPGTAHEMLRSYVEKRWRVLQSMELVQCEQPFAVPLPGIENVWYIGRLDKVVKHEGSTLVLEHKTTSSYKKDGGFQTLYVESWYNDSQVKGYQFGGALFFPDLSQVWVDAALVHKTVHDAFRFIAVAHQQPLLDEWLCDTREWVRRIRTDRAKWKDAGGRLIDGIFPKNEQSCIGKYGACSFLDICRTTADPGILQDSLNGEAPEGYTEDPWSPFDVLEMNRLIEQEDGKAK